MPRRPRDWLGAAARASELVQAVHHARGVAKAALTNASVKVPKSASNTIPVAPSGDSDRARNTFYGAVAAEVVGTLASEAILLREASLTKSGHRTGEPIGVWRAGSSPSTGSRQARFSYRTVSHRAKSRARAWQPR